MRTQSQAGGSAPYALIVVLMAALIPAWIGLGDSLREAVAYSSSSEAIASAAAGPELTTQAHGAAGLRALIGAADAVDTITRWSDSFPAPGDALFSQYVDVVRRGLVGDEPDSFVVLDRPGQPLLPEEVGYALEALDAERIRQGKDRKGRFGGMGLPRQPDYEPDRSLYQVGERFTEITQEASGYRFKPRYEARVKKAQPHGDDWHDDGGAGLSFVGNFYGPTTEAIVRRLLLWDGQEFRFTPEAGGQVLERQLAAARAANLNVEATWLMPRRKAAPRGMQVVFHADPGQVIGFAAGDATKHGFAPGGWHGRPMTQAPDDRALFLSRTSTLDERDLGTKAIMRAAFEARVQALQAELGTPAR